MIDWKTEIETGPLAAELAQYISTGNDGDIANILNRKDLPTKKRVSTSDLVNHLSDIGLLPELADAAVNTAHAQHAIARKVVATLTLAVQLGVPTINMSRSGNAALIVGLVTSGFMTTAQADGIKALANTFISRAEQLGEPVDSIKIGKALRGDA